MGKASWILASFAFSAATWMFSSSAAALTDITSSVPNNPTGVNVKIYIPDKTASPPPLVVALHYCGGTGAIYYANTLYAQYANQHGYIVIYPTSPGSCWDVNTAATLTHNAGGDSLGIVSAVRYAISAYRVDSKRVFAVGESSGAMMTNVLMGAYPDVFAGGTAYSGVPYGCFSGTSSWSSACAQGQLIKTPQYWGDLVRSGYPGYTGARPKMAVWHGTIDTTLYPQNFYEEIKQWTNVFGYSTSTSLIAPTPVSNITNQPQTGYSNSTYGGPNFYAILAQGVGHSVPRHEAYDLSWFGLDTLTPSSSATTSKATTTSATTTTKSGTTVTTTSSAAGATQTLYGQCGGISWTGPTTCAAGLVCVYSNDYYSQCLT